MILVEMFLVVPIKYGDGFWIKTDLLNHVKDWEFLWRIDVHIFEELIFSIYGDVLRRLFS